MSTSYRILFDGNDTQFLSKVDQKVGVEDIFWGPVTIDTGGDHLTLSFQTRRTHGRKKALDFSLIRSGPIPLESGSVPPHQAEGWRGSYLGSVSVGEVKIGFVAGLEAEKPVTKDFLALRDDIQPPVGGVIERDTFGPEVGKCRNQERQT